MLILAGVVLLAAFAGLGVLVAPHPPSPLDAGELGFLGAGVRFAYACRLAGEFPAYATLCAVALVFGVVRRAYLAAAVTLAVAMFVAWKTSDVFKGLFARPRPLAWFVVHESSPSYASGHAVLSTMFYGFVAYLAWTSPLPLGARRAIVAFCIVWTLTIGWSRLALGAHFPSDVFGGYLLGGAVLCFAIAVLERVRRRELADYPRRRAG